MEHLNKLFFFFSVVKMKIYEDHSSFHLDSEAEWRGGVGRSSFLDLPSVSSAVADSCGFLKQEIALGKPEGKLLAL